MKKGIVLKLALFFFILIAGAFAFDSVRTLNNAYSELQTVDDELERQETRYIGFAKGNSEVWSAAEPIHSSYENAKTLSERSAAFQNLVSRSQEVVSKVLDAANPAHRRLMDEMIGALNRHKIATAQYETVLSECNQVSASIGGTIGRMILSTPEKCDSLKD